MQRYASLFSTFFLVTLLLFVVPSRAARAESPGGITIIPATIERLANPGETITETLKITNVNDEQKEFYLYKRNIKGVEEGGVPVFAQDDTERTGYEIADWVALQTEPIEVEPHSDYFLDITINVPETASPGSHFGGVFVSAEPPKLRETGAGVGYEVGTILSIRISGDIVDTARIRSLSTGKLFYTSKKVDFNTKVENQGNILIRPRGPLEVRSMFSNKSSSMMINENLAGVFPGAVRDFAFMWEEEGLGFGRYEAILALVYDGKDGQKTIDASVTFWIFPMKIIVPIVIGFASIFIIGWLFMKFYIRHALMRAAGGRRIPMQRYRRQVGMSRFTFVFVTVMGAVVLFLIVLLIFFA